MTKSLLFDVAIVGGGVCGLSVLIQLVEKGPAGFRIAIFEKQDTVGPGLAYSKACTGARINTPAGDMGLSAANKGDFARWMKENPSEDSGGDKYPFRSYYGRYIKSEMDRITTLAQEKGIELTICNTEVSDIEQQQKTTGWIVHTTDNGSYRSVQAVISTGNHIRQLNKDLNGKPLYFASPWPSSDLLNIPKSGSVAILGSRLTAIDEAVYLSERGHTGPIYLCSRTGQLPKVQGGSKKGKPKKYERAYTLYNLAREVEDSSEHAILKVARHIYEEIKETTIKDSADHQEAEATQEREDNRIAEFRRDVELAQRDEVPIFRVLSETGPTSERYWNCLSGASKMIFLKEYLSTWISYRAAMPLRTGEKLLRLLENGQVRIIRTDSATSISHDSSGFRIPILSSSSEEEDKEEAIQVDSLVEATGMEFDITRIDTPLMRNLLSRGLLAPHPAGGIDVDFRTLRSKTGLYCLGSQTRGVHFHTTTLDRSVVHAEWVADDVLGLPPRKFLHIALFVDHDQLSQLITDQLVPRLLGAGHVPFIYMFRQKDADVESFESSSSEKESCLNVQKLRNEYGILVQSVSEADDPNELLQSLRSNHIDFGCSVKSPSSLQAEIIESFQSPRQGLFVIRPSRSSTTDFECDLQDISHGCQECAAPPVDAHDFPLFNYQDTKSTDEYSGPCQDMVQMMLQHTEQIARGQKPSTSCQSHQSHQEKKKGIINRQYFIPLPSPSIMLDGFAT